MIDSQNKKTAISLGTSLTAMALTIVINFFLAPYIVKNFGEEANGFTQLANNFINYASLITIALNSMASRFITVSYHQKNYSACNKYYSSVIIGNLFVFIFLFLPAVYCVIRLDDLINIDTANDKHVKILFCMVFINYFITQIHSILLIAVNVKNSLYIQNTINMIRTLCYAGGLIIMFSLFKPKIYYVSLVGLILSILIVPIFYIVKRKVLPEIKFNIVYFDVKIVWEMLSSGFWNTVNQCGNLLMTGFDLLLSNLFIDPIQMGILSVAKTIPNCIIQLAGTVNTSFLPNLTIAYANKDSNKIYQSLRYAMICSSILVSIPIMIMCVYGKSFYSLWVPSMNENQLTILSFLTCMSFVPFAGPQVLYNVYTTANKLKINSISVVLGGVVNFVVVCMLLNHTELGLMAVAGVSSIISIIRNLFITIPYTAKILGLKWYTFYKDVFVSLFCCVIDGIICFVCQKFIPPNNWFSMIISISVACIVSVLLLLFALLKGNLES